MTSAGSATNTTPPSNEHAEMLATKWWAGDQFRLHGENKLPRVRLGADSYLRYLVSSRGTVHAGENGVRARRA
jgi:hypothetical protein